MRFSAPHIFAAFAFVLALPFPAVAQAPTPTAITIATVNIYDAAAVQVGHTFSVGFALSNREGVQPDILYAVLLLKKDADGESAAVDVMVYEDDVLDLRAGETVLKTAAYTAPASSAGAYRLAVEARSSSGLLFSHVEIPTDFTLTKTDDSVGIEDSSLQSLFLNVAPSAGAAILNLTLDKDRYARGDTAAVTLFWNGTTLAESASAVLLPGSEPVVINRATAAASSTATVVINLADGEGAPCAETYAYRASPGEYGGLVQATLPVTAACANPVITAGIFSAVGEPLASRTFTVTSASGGAAGAAGANAGMMLVALALMPLLAATYLGARFLRKKNVVTALLFMLVAAGGVFGGAVPAQADTYYYTWYPCLRFPEPRQLVNIIDENNNTAPVLDANGNPIYYNTSCEVYDPNTNSIVPHYDATYRSTYTISLDKASYSPGETIRAYGYTGVTNWDSAYVGYIRVGISATIGGIMKNICMADGGTVCGWTGSGYTSQTFTAPSTPGSCGAAFDAYTGFYTASPYLSYGLTDIPSTSRAAVSCTVASPPTASLTPAQQTVSYGDSTTLTVSSTGADACNLTYWDNDDVYRLLSSTKNGDVSTGSITKFGSRQFNLLCWNSSGNTGWKYAYVNVPPTASLTPAQQTVSYGDSTTLTVSSTGADACNLTYWDNDDVYRLLSSTKNGDISTGSITKFGSRQFNLLCWNSSGNTGWKYAYVNVPPLSCTATTISSCTIPTTASGSSAGSCGTGYVGSCNYTCTNGTWSQNSNSCVLAACTGTVPTNASVYPDDTTDLSADTAYSYASPNTAAKCQFTCAANYTWSGSSCVAGTQTNTCPAKPATGTVYNTVSSYAQTWDGSAWTPASDATTEYNTTASATSCRYTCAANYTRSGSACIADTQTNTCPAKPATGTVYNTVSSYAQTWDGSAWTPASDATTEYNTTASATSCRYTCSAGYKWNGSACVVLPDITAGGITPTSATKGVAVTFSATVSNTGAPTGAGFTNFFQKATSALGANATSIGTASVAALPAPGAATASINYTPTSAGNLYIRICADKSGLGNAGVITESKENNNCGGWTKIVVANPTIAATCSVAPTSGLVGDAFTWTVSDVSGGSGSYEYLWLGTDSLSGINVTSVQKSYATAGTKTASVTVTSGGDSRAFACGSGVTVTALPDLKPIGFISPITAVAGVPATFSSTMQNIGFASTGASFNSFMQVATAPDDGGTITDVAPPVSMPTLAASASDTFSKSYNGFASAGTYSLRVCADKSDRDSSGTITESDEGNNCGDWTTVTVSNPIGCPATAVSNCSLPATASGGSSGSCSTGYGGTCNYSCFNGTWSQNSNSCVLAACTGTVPANATVYPGDTNGLSADTAYSYAPFNTGTKCQYSCAANYTWSGSACLADVAIGSFTNNGPIANGASASLSWSGVTGGGTITCSINNGVGAAAPAASGSKGSGSLLVNTTFTLTCGNGVGPNATRSTTVSVNANQPPTAPTITGPTAGVPSTSYPYTFTSTDPEGDQVKYQIDWDNNGTVDQTLPASGYVSSGTGQSQNNDWSGVGVKTFKARAVDNKAAAGTSSWTTYTVNMACASGSTWNGSICLEDPCAVTTISNCVLPATASGGSAGACGTGYSGACSYACSKGTWTVTTNACVPIPTATLSCGPTKPAAGPSCTINSGQSTKLFWTSTDATTCTAAGGFSTGGATANNSGVSITPNDPLKPPYSDYQITCAGPGGTSLPSTARVNIRYPQVTISASPARVTTGGGGGGGGGSTTISATATNVNSCTIMKNGTAWQTFAGNPSGSVTESFSDTNITTQNSYEIICSNDASSVTAAATQVVNVIPTFQEF